MSNLDRLPPALDIALWGTPAADVVKKCSILSVEAVQDEVFSASGNLRTAERADDLAFEDLDQAARGIEGVPDGEVQEEDAVEGMEGSPFDHRSGNGQETNLGRRPGGEGAVQQEIGRVRSQLGELAVVEGDVGIVAAGQEARRIDPVDGGRRKILIRAPDAVELILEVLQPAGQLDPQPAAVLGQPPGEYSAG